MFLFITISNRVTHNMNGWLDSLIHWRTTMYEPLLKIYLIIRVNQFFWIIQQFLFKFIFFRNYTMTLIGLTIVPTSSLLCFTGIFDLPTSKNVIVIISKYLAKRKTWITIANLLVLIFQCSGEYSNQSYLNDKCFI